MTETKWLRFAGQVRRKGATTDRWWVERKDGAVLGEVRWYSPWRQYVFEPAPGCLFNRTCLGDLAEFCDRATGAQRARPRLAPGERGR